MSGTNSGTLVHRFLHWEQAQPDAIYLTEPTPDGHVVDYTWKDVGDEARRMAGWLRSLQLPPGSSISIVGKNSAHWIIADLAIWLAGHVSVPLYPTINPDTAQYVFEHCNVRMVFVGKLDGVTDAWNAIRKVVPANARLVGLPMSPPTPDASWWSDIVADTAPLEDVHLPSPDELATIIYTSGSTGRPKGVMHSFGTIYAYATRSGDFGGYTPADRVLSYLPLAHTAERSFVESIRCAAAFACSSTTASPRSRRTCCGRGPRSLSPCRACGPSSIRASARNCRKSNRRCCIRTRPKPPRSSAGF